MANVNDIYQMFEKGITLESGKYLTPEDLYEMGQIYRVSYGIGSFEYVKENIIDDPEEKRFRDVIDYNPDFYEGIYNAMQEVITGDDEYDIVVRACREENK